MHPDTRSAIDADLPILLEHARRAAEHSYSPYSHFRVGAALKLSNGEIVTGANVENVSFGLTVCAERSALVCAISKFGPAIRIEAIAVANLNDTASPPCGACRQMLAEFVNPEAPVAFPTTQGTRTMPFHEVLPLAFEMKLK
jgi:homotetrameric cytidine deaminase